MSVAIDREPLGHLPESIGAEDRADSVAVDAGDRGLRRRYRSHEHRRRAPSQSREAGDETVVGAVHDHDFQVGICAFRKDDVIAQIAADEVTGNGAGSEGGA